MARTRTLTAETVTAVQSRSLTLVKTATPVTYDAVGDVISYSYLVTNNGNVRLAGPVTVTDDKATVTCPNVNTVGNLDGYLDPGESITCAASYSITQADLNNGSVTNTAKASAGGTDSNPDSETVTAGQAPALVLVKTATPATYDAVGDVISYSYLVTNNGNVRLAGPVTVTDDKATVTCPNVNTVGNLDGYLDPGESITCAASYSITQADLNNGSVTNTAKASVGGTDSNPDSETVTAIYLPIISVTKTANPSPASVPETGGIVTFDFVVSNSGPVAVTITELKDDKFGILVGDGDCKVGTALAAGESCTFSVIFQIPAGDYPGAHVNTFTATVQDGAGHSASDSDSETVTYTDVLPDVAVSKTANPTSVPETGGSVPFTFVVTNNSAEAATITDLTDDKFGALAGDADCQVGTVLAGGASCTFSASFSIPAGTYPGEHVNVFTATVLDNEENSDSSSDSETVTYTDVLSGLAVTKVVNWNGITPDISKTFQICISGPSYPAGNCQVADFDGAVLLWTNLQSGSYVVTETNPGSEWSVQVSGSPVTVPVDGEPVAASVTNTRKLGSLQVTKVVDWNGAVPDAARTFQICITGPSFATGDCKVAGYTGGVLTWNDLVPGVYTVAETDPGNEWKVTVDSASVTVPSDGGQAQATVTNTKLADPRITVTKIVTQTSQQQWSFVLRLDGDRRTISNEQPQATWENLEPNRTYTLSEDEPGAGWAEGSFECTVNGVSVGEPLPGGDLQLSVVPGDDVACVKYNADISGTDLDPMEEPSTVFGLFLPAITR